MEASTDKATEQWLWAYVRISALYSVGIKSSLSVIQTHTLTRTRARNTYIHALACRWGWHSCNTSIVLSRGSMNTTNTRFDKSQCTLSLSWLLDRILRRPTHSTHAHTHTHTSTHSNSHTRARQAGAKGRLRPWRPPAATAAPPPQTSSSWPT